VMPETLELLRRFADNDEIVIGAQSGSPRVLAHVCGFSRQERAKNRKNPHKH
jgi:hypothetical protein